VDHRHGEQRDGRSAHCQPPLGGRQGLFGVGDDELDTDTRRHQGHRQGKMAVDPCRWLPGLLLVGHSSNHGALEVVEVQPPQTRGDEDANGCRERGFEPPRLVAQPDHDRRDRFAEYEDRKEAESLREVRGVERHPRLHLPQNEGRRERDGQAGGPQVIADGLGHEGGYQPEAGFDGEPDHVSGHQVPRFGHVAPGSFVHHDEHHPSYNKGEGECRGGVGLAAADAGRHEGYRHHLDDGQRSQPDVVGVEAVRVEGEARPGPPQRDEQPDVAEDSLPADIVEEASAEAGNGDHEHEVVEQLEPGCGPLLVGLGCPQPWGA
jgi:hypothetical protein